jgi:formiminoglutamase
LRKAPEYPAPSYLDPSDKRMVQIIRPSSSAMPRAVNILGVPYDGAVLGRKGAAGGPKGIRESMGGFSNYNVELGLSLERSRVFDLGDMVLGGAGVIQTHAQIEAEVAAGISPSSLLVVLGGDNSISLPALRASGKMFRNLGLIVIDSHFDLRGRLGGKPTSGSSYGLAVETIGALEPRRVAEIGIHGFLNSEKYYEKAKTLGVTVYTARDVRKSGPERIAREAYRTASAGADAVYFSIDLDAVDLSQVSGVSAPSVGGMGADELVTIAYEVAKRPKVRVADLVELAPSLDPTGRSQRVAATALMCLIAGFSARSRE